MPTAVKYNLEGKKLGTVELVNELFGSEKISEACVHAVVVAQEANRRSGTHETKTRSDVSGGGRKPFRQKGTGNARQGSIRAPHFRKGGTVFGPHQRKYTQNLPRSIRRTALVSILSDRANDEKVCVLADAMDAPKTKTMNLFLDKVMTIRPLLVHTVSEEVLGKSIRNIPGANHVNVENVHVRAIADCDLLIFTEAALERFTEVHHRG